MPRYQIEAKSRVPRAGRWPEVQAVQIRVPGRVRERAEYAPLVGDHAGHRRDPLVDGLAELRRALGPERNAASRSLF